MNKREYCTCVEKGNLLFEKKNLDMLQKQILNLYDKAPCLLV